MLLFSRRIIRNVAPLATTPCFLPARSISLTGAIEKGIRTAQRGRIRFEDRHTETKNDTLSDQEERLFDRTFPARDTDADNNVVLIPGDERRSGRKTIRGPRTIQPGQESKPRRKESGVPTSIPYTTAGSEFLYGTFSVLAALQAHRRQLYKLYRLLPPGYGVETKRAKAMQPKESPEQVQVHSKIRGLAEKVGLNVEVVSGPRWQGIFSKVSDGRPHNSWILEASPIPKLPVTTLAPVKQPSDPITVSIGWASDEEKVINSIFDAQGNKASISSVRPAHRYPFMLLLDCITDTGNFGAIVRSAWFLGVDAILILEHGTAPITTNTVKASAGAFEYMPILHIKSERDFIKISRRGGWKFFAADAPDTENDKMRRAMQQKGTEALQVDGALLRHPCVLVLGNEETGIREFMRTMMDGVAGIPNARPHVADIDSLNVSVASALLTQKFFDTALPGPEKDDGSVET